MEADSRSNPIASLLFPKLLYRSLTVTALFRSRAREQAVKALLRRDTGAIPAGYGSAQ